MDLAHYGYLTLPSTFNVQLLAQVTQKGLGPMPRDLDLQNGPIQGENESVTPSI